MNDSVPFSPHNAYEFRVYAQHSYRFADDELHVTMSARSAKGLFMLRPVELVWEQYAEAVSDPHEPSLKLPLPLAERMTEALVPNFLGTDVTNVVTKIRDLERQRDRVTKQLEDLIRGIGALGARSGC